MVSVVLCVCCVVVVVCVCMCVCVASVNSVSPSVFFVSFLSPACVLTAGSWTFESPLSSLARTTAPILLSLTPTARWNHENPSHQEFNGVHSS